MMIDGQLYQSVSHWGMFKVSPPRWEAESDDWDQAPFEMDMQRAARMVKQTKEMKTCGN